MVKKINQTNWLEKVSYNFTQWIGSPSSIVVHTLLFMGIFALRFFRFPTDQILLILTTAVSLEAIYLAIFIQMTVNRNTQSLEAVEEDIEDIQEDVEGIEDDVEDITEDISEDEQAHRALLHIEKQLQSVQLDLDSLKKKGLL